MKSMKFSLILTFLLIANNISCQPKIDSFRMYEDVKITLDQPQYANKKTILVLFALPNGNTTKQTMGKKITVNDDWHFDIQHIRAKTAFLRDKMNEDIVVAYLENNFKSWPQWKQKHTFFKEEIQHIVDTLFFLVAPKN